MIHSGTVLDVGDNSGALKVKCIKVLGGAKKKFAEIGDVIKVSVIQTQPKAKVQKGKVYKAVILNMQKKYRRKDGSIISFSRNVVALLNNNSENIGTRIFYTVPRELREKFMKIVSLAPEVL